VLIIGQGLSGSLLAHFLRKKQQSVLILDDGYQRSATRVAAGLMDAISGMRLTFAWKADTLIPFARETYKTLEDLCGKRFFFDYVSYRLFAKESEYAAYEKKKMETQFSPYYGPYFQKNPLSYVESPFGSVETYQSSALQTELFLDEMSRYLSDNIIRESFNPFELVITESGVQFRKFSAKKVVFCMGDSVRFLPWFSQLPFRPAKGETLTLTSDTLHKDTVLHFGKWLVPIGQNRFKYGATYEWDDLSWDVTQAGKIELMQYLSRFVTAPTTLLSQQAGVPSQAHKQ